MLYICYILIGIYVISVYMYTIHVMYYVYNKLYLDIKITCTKYEILFATGESKGISTQRGRKRSSTVIHKRLISFILKMIK